MPHVDEMLGFVTVASAGLLAAIAVEPIANVESVPVAAIDAPAAIVRPATDVPARVCQPQGASAPMAKGPA